MLKVGDDNLGLVKALIEAAKKAGNLTATQLADAAAAQLAAADAADKAAGRGKYAPRPVAGDDEEEEEGVLVRPPEPEVERVDEVAKWGGGDEGGEDDAWEARQEAERPRAARGGAEGGGPDGGAGRGRDGAAEPVALEGPTAATTDE